MYLGLISDFSPEPEFHTLEPSITEISKVHEIEESEAKVEHESAEIVLFLSSRSTLLSSTMSSIENNLAEVGENVTDLR